VPNNAFECRRDVTVGLGKVGRILFENGAHGIDGRIAVERAFAGEHLVEDGAEREDVGARVSWLAPDLLGRHIATVPMTVPASVPATCCVGASPEASASGRVNLASPKSRILARPS